MLRRVLSRVAEIIYGDFEYSEFQGSIVAMVWGMWLMLPVSSEFRHETARLFNHDVSLTLIGSLALLLGSIQLASLIAATYTWRRWSAMAAVMYWTWSFILAVLQDWKLMPVPLLGMFAIGAAWAYWRLGRIIPRDTIEVTRWSRNSH